MQSAQGYTLLSLQNVQAYLSENAAALGNAIPADTRTLLDDSIAELSGHVAAQDGHTRTAKSAVARQHAKRVALIRDHMAPIARIAKLELEGTPELVSLSLPRGHPATERLAALAEGMAVAAEPYADVFVRTGCKPEFIQNLRTAANELLQALQDRTQSRGKSRAATSALRTRLSRARKVVHVIDGFVKSALADDPDRLAGWKLVMRVPKRPGGRGARDAAAPTGTGGATVPIAGAPAPSAAPAPASAPVAAAA